MTSLRSILCSLPLAGALACTATTSDDQADDSSSSSASSDASATMTTTTTSGTTMSTSDPTTTSSPTDTSEGSSSGDGSSDDGSSSDGADGSSSDESSSGGPTNDCTDANDPCTLELDAAHDGGGGVDQFFVYTLGDGSEHVQFDGASGDYANWDDAPGGFLCNPMGPCCLSDGNLCDKALNGQGIDFASGDTVYLYVFANAPYTVTITSG